MKSLKTIITEEMCIGAASKFVDRMLKRLRERVHICSSCKKPMRSAKRKKHAR